MLRSYVKFHQSLRVPRQNVRLVATQARTPERRSAQGRPKADENVTKKPAVGRKQRARPQEITDDGAAPGSKIVKVGEKGSIRSSKLRPKVSGSQGEAVSTDKLKSKRKQTRASMALRATPRLLARSPKHHDLASFLDYAAKSSLDPNSNVYKGTEYEYRVADTLKGYNFDLLRVGRSNDLGIDLIGHWILPDNKELPNVLNVIVQCKASKPGPKMVRELESAPAGAPSGWRDNDVFRLLVASGKSTPGVIAALQRSRYPMGYAQITLDGKVRQFRWNVAATQVALEGMRATVKYGSGACENEEVTGEEVRVMEEVIALTWMGNMWRPKMPNVERGKDAKPTKQMT